MSPLSRSIEITLTCLKIGLQLIEQNQSENHNQDRLLCLGFYFEWTGAGFFYRRSPHGKPAALLTIGAGRIAVKFQDKGELLYVGIYLQKSIATDTNLDQIYSLKTVSLMYGDDIARRERLTCTAQSEIPPFCYTPFYPSYLYS